MTGIIGLPPKATIIRRNGNAPPSMQERVRTMLEGRTIVSADITDASIVLTLDNGEEFRMEYAGDMTVRESRMEG